MQKGLLFIFLFLSSLLKAQNIDVLDYKFSLDLNDHNDTIYGEASISFLIKGNTETAVFDFASVNASGKGMQVTEVVYSHPQQTSGNFLQEDQRLTLYDVPGKNGDLVIAHVFYKGIPADGLIISKNKFGDRTFFADNWPNRAHCWLPCIDQPDDKASFEFTVTAPVQYSVISNGVKTEERRLDNGKKLTHWRETIALPTKVMVIGVARFATKIYADSPKDLPVSAWVYPQDSTKGFTDFAVAPEIVKFFSGYIAPFPYNKLANVQSTTIFGGMENASCIFYDENAITGNRSIEATIAHEIAHQWFGDMASEKSFAHLWLSEGFATYLSDLWFEKKYGREAAAERLKKERNEVIDFVRASNHPVVDSTTDFMSLLNANSYQKGAWILHMLRNEVGDTAFHQIIRTYYQEFRGSNATSDDFVRIASGVAQKNLTPFFQQWLHGPGIPALAKSWYWSKDKLVITIRQTQSTPFSFPLEIKITESNGEERTETIQVQKPVEIISLPMQAKPQKITLDPNVNLLFWERKL